MTQSQAEQSPTSGKGKAFFDRADEVAETGNWDFAIEMYIEGIRREPENLDRGYKPLREVALRRKAQGGKGPGIGVQIKYRPGKDPRENLAKASFLLSKEPGSVSYMVQFLKAAKALDLHDVMKWICDILLEAQRQAKKPDKRTLMLLTDAYEQIQDYAPAVAACEMAKQVSPNDPQLGERLHSLSAQFTIKQGKYDQEGDFTRSVKDLDKQKELVQKDAMVQDEGYLKSQVQRAKKEYLESPNVAGKINAYVDALLKFEDESYENEAIDVLNKAYKDTGAYQFKMRIGDIKIRQMTRKYRKLVQAGDKQAAVEHARKQLEFELKEYAERVHNYPTDLAVKYELGKRQFLAGQYDDAIASLQQAQRDPRRHILAMNYLGQAFHKKGLLPEAEETYRRALETEMSEQRTKEVRYNLGDILEKQGKLAEAQEEFSDVAQVDYTFRDVRQRLENIRKILAQKGAEG